VKTIEIQCIMANRRNSQASLPLHPLLTSIGSEAILLSASTDYKHSAYMKTSVSFPSHSVVCVRANNCVLCGPICGDVVCIQQ
jgi:hypothetical protein